MCSENNFLFLRMIITVTCIIFIVNYLCMLFNAPEGIDIIISIPLALIVYIGFLILFERQCKKEKDSNDS